MQTWIYKPTTWSESVWTYSVRLYYQRKLGSNLSSYGWLLPDEGWYETLHHIRIHSMKGGVRIVITQQYTQWRMVWDLTSHKNSLKEGWCETSLSIKSHTTLPWVYSYVMYKVSHHPSLSVLLCDVKSHTTLHWVYCYVMSSLGPPFIECIVMWCQVSHHPSLSVLLCGVKSHTTIDWIWHWWKGWNPSDGGEVD